MDTSRQIKFVTLQTKQALIMFLAASLFLLSGCIETSNGQPTSKESVIPGENTFTPNVICHEGKTQTLGGITVVGDFPVWTSLIGGKWYPGRLEKPYEGMDGKSVWFVDKKVHGELRVTGNQIDGDRKLLFFDNAQTNTDNNGNEYVHFLEKPSDVFILKDASMSNYQSPIPEGYSGNIKSFIIPKPGCYQILATIQNYKVEMIIKLAP